MNDPIDRNAQRYARAALHAGFVLAGMATTLLGPLLPFLQSRLHLDDAQAGALFAAQFIGSVAGGVFSIAIANRFGGRRALSVGFLLVACGVGGVGAAALPIAIASAAVYGLGLGLVVPTTNLFVTHAAPERAASASSLVNLAWGAGALSWPGVVAVASSAHRPLAAAWVLAAACVAMAVLFERANVGEIWPRRRRSATAERTARPKIRHILVAFSIFLFIYGAIEPALGGWLGTFTRRLDVRGSRFWLAAPTTFWGGLTLGRLATPLLLRAVSEASLLSGGLFTAVLALLAIEIGATPAVIVVGGLVAGFGLAAVFPLTVAALTREVRHTAVVAVGPLIALGGVGGAIGPWFVGAVSTETGSWRLALAAPIVGCIGLIGLHFARLRRRTASTDSAVG